MSDEVKSPGTWSYAGGMLDITDPDVVEVEFREDGKVIWVNVDGRCALRICRVTSLFVTDNRD